MDIVMGDGQRNTSIIDIQILCPEQVYEISNIEAFTFMPFDYIAERPVPWIESIFHNGTMDIRFNSTLVLQDM